MASITQRAKNKDQVQIRRKGYEPISRMFPTKAEAQAYVRDVEGRIDRGQHVATRSARETTLSDCLQRYLESEHCTKRNGYVQEASRIRCWLKYPLCLRSMASLNSADFAAYRDERRKQGAAWATIRSELSIISTVFVLAASEWNMPSLENPLRLVRTPSPNNKRSRRAKTALMSLDGGPARLVSELDAIKNVTNSVELPALIDIAVETTMRRGEHTAVCWTHVNLERNDHPGSYLSLRLHAERTQRHGVVLARCRAVGVEQMRGQVDPERDPLLR
jgi:integrase